MIFRSKTKSVFVFALGFVLLVGLTYASMPGTPQIKSDEKSKVSGTIAARSGDLVQVKDKKTGQLVVVSISDNTKIEREKGKVEFFRHKDMDVTAMVPGLTIEAEGVGNAKGQLVASKITFIPDEFAIEVAEEQQIMANKAAAGEAQSTANQGVAAAGQAQTSANQAQSSANQADNAAVAAGDVAVMVFRTWMTIRLWLKLVSISPAIRRLWMTLPRLISMFWPLRPRGPRRAT
jgi:hypothetical protein